MDHIIELKHYMREQVRTKPQLNGYHPDKLTVVTLALNTHKRFYEGYHGEKVMSNYMREGAELRRKNRPAYEDAIAKLSPHLSDLRAMDMKVVRAVETLTSSDLVYSIGMAREAEYSNDRPAFSTDLYDLVKKRTRNDLTQIVTGGGVNLSERMLRIRAENTSNMKASWSGKGETYSMYNLELGLELTWEAILNNKLDEWNDAMFELGQDALRTRAWLIVDAIRRSANFVELPHGQNGPDIDNIENIAGYLGQQVVDGSTYSRTLTDIYVPGTWRGTAGRAISGNTVVFVGGANSDLQRLTPINPAANVVPHFEEVMGEIPVSDPRQSNLDWIAADPSKKPVEFATLAAFTGGPRILTKIPNIVELDNMGSFSEHVIETKASDVAGAEVRDKTSVVLVSGRKPQPVGP